VTDFSEILIRARRLRNQISLEDIHTVGSVIEAVDVHTLELWEQLPEAVRRDIVGACFGLVNEWQRGGLDWVLSVAPAPVPAKGRPFAKREKPRSSS
jgi:hypothetical protein